MMSSLLQNHIASDIILFLILLSMANFSIAEEGEDMYLRSGIHDIPIYSRSVSTNPVSIHRRNDFFLKAGKSVPRIGRRNYEYVVDPSHKSGELLDFDSHHLDRRNDFFFKAHHKQIPRIGRRDGMATTNLKSVEKSVLEDSDIIEPKLMKKDDSITSQMEQESVLAAWPWFRNPDMFSPYQKRGYRQNYPDDASDFNERI